MLERLRRATEACDTTYGEKSPEYSFIQGQKKRLLFILLLIVSTFFGACLAVSLGAVDVPLLDTIKILLNQLEICLMYLQEKIILHMNIY